MPECGQGPLRLFRARSRPIVPSAPVAPVAQLETISTCLSRSSSSRGVRFSRSTWSTVLRPWPDSPRFGTGASLGRPVQAHTWSISV